jgi:hypothetical protein
VISNNPSNGLYLGTNAAMRIAHSVVTGNGTGIGASGIQSFGDNDIAGNTNDALGNLTTISTH